MEKRNATEWRAYLAPLRFGEHVDGIAKNRKHWKKLGLNSKNYLRLIVFMRDGWRCCHCGGTEALTIDHIRPLAQRGNSRPENLQTLCWWCNQQKADLHS